jgi:hypothetical protein
MFSTWDDCGWARPFRSLWENGKRRMNRVIVCCVGLLAVTGCSTIQVQKDKLTAAKKVAIVGYSGSLHFDNGGQAKNGLASAIGAAKGANDLFSGKLSARRIEQAEAGYAELGKRLASSFGFEVSPHGALMASSTLAQQLQKTPSSGVMVLGLQHLPDVLRAEVVNTMKPDARRAVAAELGVDALASLKIRYEVGKTGGFAVAGMGKTTNYPVAVLDFTVFDASGKEVWHDFYARGEVASQGLATTMGAEIVANETEVLDSALQTGLDALLTRYNQAK